MSASLFDPRWGRAVGAVVLAAVAAPFFAGRWLPFLDLPQHVGLASVIHHYGDAAFDFQRFYVVDLAPLPYWGFYLPVHLLAYLMPVATAAKVVLVASAVALPVGLWDVLGAFGRDRRLAVLAAPLAFNTNLFMGFTSFVVALPVWLFALAAAERFLSGPDTDGAGRRSVWAGLLAVLVYLCHGQAFLLLLCALVVLAVLHRPPWRALLTYAPALGLFVYWVGRVVLAPAEDVAAGEHLSVLGALGVPGRVTFNAPGHNLAKLGEYLFDVYPGPVEDALFLGLFGLLAVLVVLRPEPPRPKGPGLRSLLRAWRLELLAGGLLVSYFVSPMEIGLQWYVGPRHLVFAALLAPAFAGPDPLRGARRWLLVPLTVLAILVPLHAATEVRAFQTTVGPFEEVVRGASGGGRTLGLVFDRGEGRPVRTWPLLHFAGYLQAERGGDLGFSFAGLPSIPVRYRPGMQAPHPYEWRPGTFVWPRHGAPYDRFLIRGRATGDAARLGERAARTVRAGGWVLHEMKQ